VLRDSVDVSLWNAMDGKITSVQEEYTKTKDGSTLTRIPLKMGAVSALFFVQEK